MPVVSPTGRMGDKRRESHQSGCVRSYVRIGNTDIKILIYQLLFCVSPVCGPQKIKAETGHPSSGFRF